MDITQFIASQREEGLVNGDHGHYKKILGRRVRTIRKRLHFTSSLDQKGSVPRSVSAEDIHRDSGFIQLLLLSSERAWAHALHIKATQSLDTLSSTISSSSRRQITSRLHKAALISAHLIRLLEEDETQASGRELREAWAYHASLTGAAEFERARWQACAAAYSVAYRLYEAPSAEHSTGSKGSGREILENYIEPSLRYAAYQLKVTRTTSIETLVESNIRPDNKLAKQIMERDAKALTLETSPSEGRAVTDPAMIPKTIEWRSRVVPLEDVSTAQALATVASAKKKLVDTLSKDPNSLPHEKAVAYDGIIVAVQDAVDAAKNALGELARDGIPTSDPRFQSLQITWTAVGYSFVEWTIRRNRILCGDADGVSLDGKSEDQAPQATGAGGTAPQAQSKNKSLARLKEHLVLYNASAQSLENAKSLPGVPADAQFLAELQSLQSYFQALRCLSIARSYSIVGGKRQSLALLLRAQRLLVKVTEENTKPQVDKDASFSRIEISQEQLNKVRQILQALVLEHRGVVDLSAMDVTPNIESSDRPCNLSSFFWQPVDLSRLVCYPPKITPIPVKPIFLDIAYNFIEYTQSSHAETKNEVAGPASVRDDEKAAPNSGRKGWFGFGR